VPARAAAKKRIWGGTTGSIAKTDPMARTARGGAAGTFPPLFVGLCSSAMVGAARSSTSAVCVVERRAVWSCITGSLLESKARTPPAM
jgi:hypothetical protein